MYMFMSLMTYSHNNSLFERFKSVIANIYPLQFKLLQLFIDFSIVQTLTNERGRNNISVHEYIIYMYM